MRIELAKELNSKFESLEADIFTNRNEIEDWSEIVQALNTMRKNYLVVSTKSWSRKKKETPVDIFKEMEKVAPINQMPIGKKETLNSEGLYGLDD